MEFPDDPQYRRYGVQFRQSGPWEWVTHDFQGVDIIGVNPAKRFTTHFDSIEAAQARIVRHKAETRPMAEQREVEA
jgi:hypothetical protein